jgi:ABC-2 type transport system permease protein
VSAFAALLRAGFARYSTYRQATVAATFTNTMFGLLRMYVLLGALGAAATVGGYDRARLGTYVWLGQGIIGVVLLWGGTDLGDRVRSGDVVLELLRPVDPLWTYLAADLGRAGHAVLTRILVPVLVGALAFDMYVPRRALTVPLFALSLTLGATISFAARHLATLSAFWLLDIRGVLSAYSAGSGLFSGIVVPVTFYPDVLRPLVWATPFPWLLQVPLDVACERGSPLLVLGQAGWAAALLALCALVQRRAVRTLVVQGG